MTAYHYLAFTLARGRPSWNAFARAMLNDGARQIERVDGALLGVFAPQLGFASNEAVALVRGPESFAPAALSSIPHVTALEAERLYPTVRPRDEDVLETGGIYVHRWFTIDGDRTADFIDLSNRAWGGFEGSYDTKIFGLFRAEQNSRDLERGEARLLLLTWYRSHGVWEASREQAHDTASLFARRHELTRSTIGRSSVRVAGPA